MTIDLMRRGFVASARTTSSAIPSARRALKSTRRGCERHDCKIGEPAVKDFRAIFRCSQNGEALFEMPLEATTIESTIDEATASGATERFGAGSLDIVADGATVETVGLGADRYRT